MKQISADTCGRMQREGAMRGGGGQARPNKSWREFYITSNARERRRREKCTRVCTRVRACVGGEMGGGGACKHSVTNQFSGHRSLEVENADAASYMSGIK